MKRIIRRPWGRKKDGGWVIQPNELLTALKDGDIAEIGKLQVGAKQLSRLIQLMQFPDQELLVSANGQLEVQNIKRVIVQKNGHRTTTFRKPRLRHSFRINPESWLPTKVKVTLVIKPRKF